MSEVRPDFGFVGLGLVKSDRLKQRTAELRRSSEVRGSVNWPVVVRSEGCRPVDCCCRYTAVEAMEVPRAYAYVGTPTKQR